MMVGGVTKLQLPRIGDETVEWHTKQDKEVGEVMEVSGGRRFVVVSKRFLVKTEDREQGFYRLIEENTGAALRVRFEYEVEENGK